MLHSAESKEKKTLAKRIKHEEKFLEEELDGYREYKQKVKYRLIPFVW